ncbi:hypothetical protein Psch_02830 [Pelotomaculum schinkii]|uniref:Uncharacterized protein n=1 Tax=Pelotomaculum schinkii TaxID=78350 RepID=A0A4Y7RAN0_9FIRM|nr:MULTISPECIES: hypothetical protein [Pelotomaculum]TEB05789.1 hypothetical protein Psch_02830 [Pelotomaculum schinkii]TEB17956.1 hypothetical protein Psfp_00079 [Pelotomaculum sp. FP]
MNKIKRLIYRTPWLVSNRDDKRLEFEAGCAQFFIATAACAMIGVESGALC